ncbi:MAG: Uma2 family endonuclease [Pseudomonadales bacterium]|nr:Uma2 family endonuclease [Pseudomonadales bacterium]
MAFAVRKTDGRVSEEAYFELEKQTDNRHEYIDGYVYAMVGGSIQHGTLVSNIVGKIWRHLEGKPCQVFSEGTKVKTPTAHKRADYVYPDVVVDCSVEKADDNMLTTPVLIFEVLSASTRRYDETTKFQVYASISTLQEYVLVDQDSAKIEIQRRRTDWAIEKYFLGDSITFEHIQLTLTVEEIYDRVVNEEVTEWFAQKAREAVEEKKQV